MIALVDGPVVEKSAGEVILMAVEMGHEHDAGLVEARGGTEDVAR